MVWQPESVLPAAPETFLERLRAGRLTLVLGIRAARTTEIVRIAHASGHHAILVDLEHSGMPVDVATALCATAGDLGLTPFVRVPERDYGVIGRLLDGGAQGIVAPRVETAEQAETVARACRFPPSGQRSQIALLPQLGMRPLPAAEANPAADARTVVQILVETPRGIAAADEIAAVPGVDMLAVGANDLTAELGAPGRYDDPRVTAAVESVAQACQRHGKLLFLAGVGDLDRLAELAALGACPLRLTGMDTDLLYAAARSRAQAHEERHASTTDGQEPT